MSAPEPVSAHALLVEQHAFLRRLARSLVPDPERADDLAQDVAVLALLHPPRSGSSPRAWLARVLRNRAVNLARSETRRRDREARVPEPAPQPTPPELDARLRVQRQVIEAVARLEEPYRSTILLRYDQDLTPTAIAERLGVPVATVKTRLARALERLRVDLDARDEPGTPAWSVVLLAGLTDLRPSAASAAMAAGGAIVATKLVWAGAVLATAALAGTWWTLREPAVRGTDDPLAVAEVVESTNDDPSGTRPPTIAMPLAGEVRAPARLPTSSIPASVAPPAWALDVTLHGVRDGELEPASIEVIPDGSTEPAAILLQPLASSWTLDLGSLFEGLVQRPERLLLRVDHPSYLPGELAVLVPREWADAGTQGGRFATELTLREPKAFVTGEVQVAERAAEFPVQVAIHAFHRDRPRFEAVDRVAPDASGRFRLRADDAERHVVVAYEHRKRSSPIQVTTGEFPLRPASVAVSLVNDQVLDVGALVLEPGFAIAGSIEGAATPGLRVQCGSAAVDARGVAPIAWHGDRFENGGLIAETDAEGKFRFGGLGPISYTLNVTRAPVQDGPKTNSFWRRPESPTTVTAPADGVRLRYDLLQVILEVSGGGRPVPNARITIFGDEGDEHSRGSQLTTETDEDGRLRLEYNVQKALHVVASDARFGTKEARFEAWEMVPEARLSIEFDGEVLEPASLIVRFDGALSALGDPKSVFFWAYDLSSWSEADVAAALGATLPGEQDLPVGVQSALFPNDAVWNPGEGLWTFRSLRPGRYLFVARRPATRRGDQGTMLGTTFIAELSEGKTSTHTWQAELGGVVRLEITAGRDAPDLARVGVLARDGEDLPVWFQTTGSAPSSTSISSPGAYEVHPVLPAGEYTLKLYLSGRIERTIGFRVDAGQTIDLHVDLADL